MQPPPRRADAPDLPPSVARALSGLLRDGDIPGLSVACIRRGRLAWAGALGRRNALDAAAGGAVDPETVFEGASLGKPVVALAALRLVETGRLSLDETAERIVPFPELTDDRKARITVRQLLSHSSGLAFAMPALDAEPGARFAYSTLGYRYLQRIVEARQQETLENWARRTLFDPLQMARSSFVYSPAFAQNRARGRNWLRQPQESMPSAAGTGAFDLITTAQDYARLWEAVLSGRILGPATLGQLFAPQIAIVGEFYDPAIPKKAKTVLACGLGLLLQRQGGRWIGFQWGDNGGSTGLLIVDPGVRNAAVFLANAEDGLHAAEALVQVGGMRDAAMRWVGYEQFTQSARVAWKRITQASDRHAEEGIATFQMLLARDRKTVLPLARNLGFYQKFKGRPAAAEPFFREAIAFAPDDEDLRSAWIDVLRAIGKTDEADAAQKRAKTPKLR
jgi:CubicO group peptidase (beta-lactamase class C family)